jgi:integrase
MPKKKTVRDGVYTRADRSGFWISYLDAAGVRRQVKTAAQTVSEAKTIRAAYIARAEKQRILGIAEADKITFADVADKYLQYQKPRVSPKRYERIEGIIRLHLKPAFKGEIGNVTRSRITDFVTARLGKASSGSVRQEFLCLKHILRLAHEEWNLIPDSPAKTVTLQTLGVKLAPDRVRYLHPDELLTILSHCPEWLRPIVVLAVATGLRRGNIVRLRWTQYDARTGKLNIKQTKNREPITVYLNKIGLAGLTMAAAHYGAGTVGRIFPDVTEINVSVTFGRVCKAAGIADFHFHDLRHTHASWLKMTGADIHTIAMMLGHKDIRQTVRYSHVSSDFLTDHARQLDGVFSSLLQLNPAPDRDRDVTGEIETNGADG